MANSAHITQVGIEVIQQTTGVNARMTQVGIEVIQQATAGNAHVTQVGIEIIKGAVVASPIYSRRSTSPRVGTRTSQ